MNLLYYVEMKDTNNPDEWSNKVDLYGYENQVLAMAMGYSKSVDTNGFEETKTFIDNVVAKLEASDFVVINKEIKEKLSCDCTNNRRVRNEQTCFSK
jgi:hypothetical protein